MSISEQVEKLRYGADIFGTVGSAWELNRAEAKKLQKMIKEAADTIESLSAKLQAADCGGGWIYCGDGNNLPEEHDSMFAKFKGTEKWDEAMFEKISDDVNVTVEYENGKRKTLTLHTIDGKWKTDRIVKFKVIAWQPLPAPYHEP